MKSKLFNKLIINNIKYNAKYGIYLYGSALILIISLITNFKAGRTYPAWEDEAVISDFLFNYVYHGIWRQDIWWEKMDIWMYGPIYFYLQKPIIDAFGFYAHIVRIENSIVTYLLTFLVGFISWKFTKRPLLSLSIFILFLLDFSINRSIVLGRIDTLATFFSILGFYFSCRYKNFRLMNICMAALFSSCAFLSAFRSIFLLPGIFFMILYHLNSFYHNSGLNKRIYVHSFLFLLIFLFPIILWVNSLGGFFNYVSAILNSDLGSRHKGFSLFRIPEDYIFLPILFMLFFSVRKIVLRDPRIIAILITFSCFSIFVKELGPYRSMIIGYLYIAAGLMSGYFLQSCFISEKIHILKTSYILVFLISLLSFSIRAFDIFVVNENCRSTKEIDEFLLDRVKKNSIVAAGYEYYYLLKPKTRKFYPLYNLINDKIKIDTYPDYIVVNNIEFNNPKFQRRTWIKILSENYTQIGFYDCTLNDFGLDKYFQSRRNYHGTRVYVLKTLMD
jgi:hypothetical protein